MVNADLYIYAHMYIFILGFVFTRDIRAKLVSVMCVLLTIVREYNC